MENLDLKKINVQENDKKIIADITYQTNTNNKNQRKHEHQQNDQLPVVFKQENIRHNYYT